MPTDEMDADDRALGLDRSISRRDFLNGVGVVAASALASGCVGGGATSPLASAGGSGVYPPTLTGMRGSHAGSFEVAHQLAFQGRRDWGVVAEPDPDVYDLVIVGGGISGLSAAYFQLERQPGAKILILENHDDFGGHAKRNEFQVGDRTILSYGGSQTLESPSYYSDVAKGVLDGIGVDVSRFKKAYDDGFYRRNGLRGGVYFDRATYGVDRIVPVELVDFSSYLPLAPAGLPRSEAVAQMPLSEPARRELLRLLETDENQLTEVPADQQEDFLWTISYRDFLSRYLDIREPEVFALLEGAATDVGLTFDAVPAEVMISYVGMPGFNATALVADPDEYEPYINHFPDGNASIARLLVRKMIPAVAPGSSMDDVVAARFDYSRLDESASNVRLRLDSTVVRAVNERSPSGDRVAITYVRHGRASRVRAKACVLAGYNAMIPYLCPELPEEQRQALSLAVKSPILYSTVLLRNWRAWKKLGFGAFSAPGSYHSAAMLDFPVSFGGFEFPDSPDDPIVVHLERFGLSDERGLTGRQGFKSVRQDLLVTPYEAIEREIRRQLGGALGAGGFDPAQDIKAITVNRWAHGYAYYYNGLFDPEYAPGEAPHEIGRQRFGRIAIANSDAGADATLDSAIDQAHRAIGDLYA